jgi:hypothetical protein
MEICLVAAVLNHADRRAGGGADMKKLNVAFHDCANAPKKTASTPNQVIYDPMR